MNRNQKVSSQFGWAPSLTKELTLDPHVVKTVAREVVTKTVRDMERNIAGHTDLASNSNQIRVTSPSTDAPSQSRKFVQKNRNAEPGSQTILTAGNAPSYEQLDQAAKVESRSKCARFCKQQGRTSCVVCHGAGWETVAKTEPSRNVNKSRDIIPQPFQGLRKV